MRGHDHLPVIISIVEVPGGSVAHYVPIGWLGDHRLLPERWRHLDQTERRKEFFRQTKQSSSVVTLRCEKEGFIKYREREVEENITYVERGKSLLSM